MDAAPDEGRELAAEVMLPVTIDDVATAVRPLEHVAPRLKLVHMLAWMVLTAVLLGAILVFMGRGAQQDAAFLIAAMILSLATSIWAAQLGGVLMFLDAQRRNFVFPQYPGDYLLFYGGVVFLCRALAVLAIVFFPRGGELIGWVACGLGLLMPAGSYLIAASLQRERLWRAILVAMGLAQLAALGVIVLVIGSQFGEFLLLAPLGLLAAALVGICSSVVSDLMHRRERGWTHWLGVATTLAHDGLILAYFVIVLIMFQMI